tara:strand:- start:1270 stop:1839 length:570 start_codon:yes stop_codon:yes gene_type:complete
MSFWKWMQQNAGTGSVMFPSQITPNLVEEAEKSITRGGLPARIVPSPINVLGSTMSDGTRAGNVFGEFMEEQNKKKGPKVGGPTDDGKKAPKETPDGEEGWRKFWGDEFQKERDYQEDLYKKGQILKGVKGIQQGMDKWQLGPAMLAADTGNRMASQWGNIKVPNFVTSPAVAPHMVRSAYSFQDFLRV